MYYAKARFYSADDKRFVAMDPIKGTITEPLSLVPYVYCVDNPLRWVDPMGRRVHNANEKIIEIGGGTAAKADIVSANVAKNSSQNKTTGAPKPQENSISSVPSVNVPKMMRNNRSIQEYNNKMSLRNSFNSTGNSQKKSSLNISNRIVKYVKTPSRYYPTFSCPESDSCFYDSLEDWATNFSNDAKSAGQAIWDNQGYWHERARNANGVGDWIYSSANWFTLGSIEGFIEGTHSRWDAMLAKPGIYTVTNYFTLGIAETFHKAIFPQEHGIKVLSFEHVLNFGSAALTVYTAGKGYQQSHLDPHSVAGVAYEAFRPENVAMSQAAMSQVAMEQIRIGEIIGDFSVLNADERSMVIELIADGHTVEIIPTCGVKTADFFIDGIETELKTLHGSSLGTAVKRIRLAFEQSKEVVIINARLTGMTLEEANSVLDRATGSLGGILPGKVYIITNFGTVGR